MRPPVPYFHARRLHLTSRAVANRVRQIGIRLARTPREKAAPRQTRQLKRGDNHVPGWTLVRSRMTDTAQHDSERRRHRRVKAKIPVEIRWVNSTPMRTAVEEISLCGCYIETMFTMEVGTRLSLVFSCGDHSIATDAVVATKYPQVGNGIDFVDMAPEDRLKLERFLSEAEA